MAEAQGILKKMLTNKRSGANDVEYSLPVGSEHIELASALGKSFSLDFTGNIFCLDTGKKLKKTYGQGYSWESFMTLAKCDSCNVRPELCHFAAGTCREPEWGKEHCMRPHIIYLANSSQLKVGITRKVNVPGRWMDQGAVQALPILEVKDRRASGMIEVQVAKKYADKTQWRKMLSSKADDLDLYSIRDQVYREFAELIQKYEAKKLSESQVQHFDYPVLEYPLKISSLNLRKNPIIKSTLMGIKGQYLIFESGVFNVRKHQGYEVKISF